MSRKFRLWPTPIFSGRCREPLLPQGSVVNTGGGPLACTGGLVTQAVKASGSTETFSQANLPARPLKEPVPFVSSVNLADDAADLKWMHRLGPSISTAVDPEPRDCPHNETIDGINLQQAAIRKQSFSRSAHPGARLTSCAEDGILLPCRHMHIPCMPGLSNLKEGERSVAP